MEDGWRIGGGLVEEGGGGSKMHLVPVGVLDDPRDEPEHPQPLAGLGRKVDRPEPLRLRCTD